MLTSLNVKAQVVERILAIVNNKPILLSDLRAYKNKLLYERALVEPSLLFITDPDKLITNPKALLDHLINESLLDQEIKRKNITVSERDIINSIKQVSQSQGLTLKEFLKRLKAEGISTKAFRIHAKKSLERKSFFRKVIQPRIQITEKDLKKEVRKTKKKIVYVLSHMIISDKEGELKAEEKAKQVYEKVKAKPQNFDLIAKDYADNPNTKLGAFSLEDIRQELRPLIKNLRKGQISKLIRLQNGYFQILKLNDKKNIKDKRKNRTLQAREVLMQKYGIKELKKWLEEKRQVSFVKINS